MSLYFRLGAGLALGATLLAATGCFNTDVTAFDDEEPSRFDKTALDMYLTDVAPPMVEVSVNDPESYEGFYGEWEAKLDMKAEMEKERAKRIAEDPNYDPAADQMAEAFAAGMAEMMSFALNIKEDKTFSMTMMFFPVEGKWEQKGEQLWLHPETVMGMSKEELAKMGGENGQANMNNDEPLVLKITDGGKALVAVDPKGEFGSEELVFRRKAAG